MTLTKTIKKLLVAVPLSVAMLTSPTIPLNSKIENTSQSLFAQTKKMSEKECIETFLDITQDYTFAKQFRSIEYTLSMYTEKLSNKKLSKSEIEKQTIKLVNNYLEGYIFPYSKDNPIIKKINNYKYEKQIELKLINPNILNFKNIDYHFGKEEKDNYVLLKNIHYKGQVFNSNNLNEKIQKIIQNKVKLINDSLGEGSCFFAGEAMYQEPPKIRWNDLIWYVNPEYNKIMINEARKKNSPASRGVTFHNNKPSVHCVAKGYIKLSGFNKNTNVGLNWEDNSIGNREAFGIINNKIKFLGKNDLERESYFRRIIKGKGVNRIK